MWKSESRPSGLRGIGTGDHIAAGVGGFKRKLCRPLYAETPVNRQSFPSNIKVAVTALTPIQGHRKSVLESSDKTALPQSDSIGQDVILLVVCGFVGTCFPLQS